MLKTKYATENVPSTLRRREVADRHADRVAARLAAQAGNHRPRQVDPVDRDAAARQRQCDPSRPDAQFQGAPTAGEPRQNVDRRVHNAWLEHVRRRLVIPRRDTFPEVAVLVVHHRTVSRTTCLPPVHFAVHGMTVGATCIPGKVPLM